MKCCNNQSPGTEVWDWILAKQTWLLSTISEKYFTIDLKIFCKFWLNILSSWFRLSNKTELSLVDNGRQKVAAQFAQISGSVFFKNIFICLSYGQNELKRNNIYVDTFSLQEETFILNKCFLHLCFSIIL